MQSENMLEGITGGDKEIVDRVREYHRLKVQVSKLESENFELKVCLAQVSKNSKTLQAHCRKMAAAINACCEVYRLPLPEASGFDLNDPDLDVDKLFRETSGGKLLVSRANPVPSPMMTSGPNESTATVAPPLATPAKTISGQTTKSLVVRISKLPNRIKYDLCSSPGCRYVSKSGTGSNIVRHLKGKHGSTLVGEIGFSRRFMSDQELSAYKTH
ncbi:hypothetical protein HDE_10681 [Halotydeus destructor]|nr:hypothetical protein HDE_10681 [Halotydeus destructor]